MITDHNTDNNFVVVLCIYMVFIYSIRYILYVCICISNTIYIKKYIYLYNTKYIHKVS